jgi:DNA-binding NarL/FixJ family response regulator
MIRVMLVDDHALVRMGFRMLLADARVEVVAEVENGEQACLEYPRVQPDVVVMDLSMPGMGGLEAVRRLIAQDPLARVLVLSAHEDSAHPRRVLRAGALGYLTKRSAPDALIAAVTAVAAHQAYVDPHRAVAGDGAGQRPDQPGRGPERARVRCLHPAGARSQRGADRRQPQALTEHGGHASLSHQAKARCEQPVGVDAFGVAVGSAPDLSAEQPLI